MNYNLKRSTNAAIFVKVKKKIIFFLVLHYKMQGLGVIGWNYCHNFMHVTHGYKHKNIPGVEMPCGHYVCVVACWEIYPRVVFLYLQLSRTGKKEYLAGLPLCCCHGIS